MVPLLALTLPALAWNPDAGVIPSLTDAATPFGTSNPDALPSIVDGNTATHWQTGACYPTGWLSRPDLDLALGRCATAGTCTGTSGDATPLTDGNERGTTVSVPVGTDGVARVRVTLAEARTLARVRLHGVWSGSLSVVGERADGSTVALGTAGPSSEARTPVDVDLSATDAIVEVRLEGATAFTLNEVGLLGDVCFQVGGVDFGSPREVGWVRLRHWAGGNTWRSQLVASDDGVTWTHLAELDPESLAYADVVLGTPVTTRFLAVRHDIDDGDWKKAYVWELDAWDAIGPYGPEPVAEANPVVFAELLGVNGLWGWGTSAFSDSAPAGAGPDRWDGRVGHARNYHNLTWDVTDPDHVPDYDAMAAGSGTEAMSWLDWDREYGAWRARGIPSIDVSLQFTERGTPAASFDDPYAAGFGFGRSFARHFGPTAGTGAVASLEVGNEPWDYPADLYAAYLDGMTAGVKEGDPAMMVLAGAFQAHTPELPGATGGHYMGARVSEAAAAHLDAVNLHAYSFWYDAAGVRRGVPPEHPESSMREVFSGLRWRDTNLPGKPVWLTEWGWDSPGGGEDCTGTECVSEVSQARYLVRGAMLGARWGLARMTWYFFANVEGSPGLFGRSGLLASKATNFAPKRSYVALGALVARLGDRRFLSALQEDDAGYAYLLGGADGVPTHLVAWLPVPGDDATTSTLVLPAPGEATNAFTLDGSDAAGEEAALPSVVALGDAAGWEVPVSAAPVVITFTAFPEDTGGNDTSVTDSGTEGGSDTAGVGFDDTVAKDEGGCGCASVDSWGGGHAAAVGPSGAQGGERGEGAFAGRRGRAGRGQRPTPPPEVAIQWRPRGGPPLRNASPGLLVGGTILGLLAARRRQR